MLDLFKTGKRGEKHNKSMSTNRKYIGGSCNYYRPVNIIHLADKIAIILGGVYYSAMSCKQKRIFVVCLYDKIN